jgi:hypothetical protein
VSNENNFLTKLLWCFLGVIALSAIMLINHYSPYIPDYDGLSYFESVKIYNEWLFGFGELNFTGSLGDYATYWPITNALSVVIAAIFYDTLNLNLIPTYINSLYILIFAIYISKIRSVSYAYISILLLCAHTFFYRLFTTLTSEFSVGLWIFALLLTLIAKHERRFAYLSALVIIGLLLRTVDIVFILCATTTYVTLYYFLFKEKRYALLTLGSVGLTLILSLPIFWEHYKATYIYVLKSQTGISNVSWKAMSGVWGGFDVPLRYIEYIQLYNPLLLPITVVFALFAFYSTSINNKFLLITIATPLALIFPLFMSEYLNIQTTFWVFVPLIFIVCEIGFHLVPLIKARFNYSETFAFNLGRVGLVVLSIFTLLFIKKSWGYETQFLNQQKMVSEIAFEIAKVVNKIPETKFITSNFWGIGALDYNGLSWGNNHNIIYKGVADIYSKKKFASYYLDFDNQVNIFISAHDNYSFPLAFGINEHVKEINDLFKERSGELGFRQLTTITKYNQSFDIWYRPSTQAHLQFINFRDYWIATELPLDIGNEDLCSDQTVSGRLNVSLNFPNSNVVDYKPPFVISLINKNSEKLISSAVVNDYGESHFYFDIKNISCGKYHLVLDKAFSTKKDSRKLSAQFINLDSVLKFDLSEKGSE